MFAIQVLNIALLILYIYGLIIFAAFIRSIIWQNPLVLSLREYSNIV